MNMNKKKKRRGLFLDIGAMCLCGVVFGVSINCFTAPNHIAPGGATGLATLMYDVWGVPIGTGVLLINIPLFIIAAVMTRFSFLGKTIGATIVTSLFIDVLAFLPAYTENALLAALFAGVLTGIGLSCVLARSIATGGSDMAAQLLKLKFPHLRTGSVVFAVDGVVVALAGFVYRDITSTLYATITIFVIGYVIDAILTGLDDTSMAYVISEKGGQISKAITEKLERGATLLYGQGAYSGEERKIVLCVIRPFEVHKLKTIINEVDPACFLILAKAGEVFGDGFKRESSIRKTGKGLKGRNNKK